MDVLQQESTSQNISYLLAIASTSTSRIEFAQAGSQQHDVVVEKET